jgi:uncharacterized protein YhfF
MKLWARETWIEVEICRFDAVEARFAYDYGEGDRSLADWQEFSWAYWVVDCAAHGWQPTPSMPLVCERFRVVYRG